MEKIKSINCYSKNGKQFVVVTTNDNKTLVINRGLVDYALTHVKEVKK